MNSDDARVQPQGKGASVSSDFIEIMKDSIHLSPSRIPVSGTVPFGNHPANGITRSVSAPTIAAVKFETVFTVCVLVLSTGAFANLFPDRKSTRLNSSHRCISYAVFCLKKKRHSKHDTYKL